MSEINRYEQWHDCENNGGMEEESQGEFVKHADHLAALKQARIDAVLDLKHELSQLGTDVSGECVWVDDMANVIDYHIEQLKEQGE